jgi:hypothetical protein
MNTSLQAQLTEIKDSIRPKLLSHWAQSWSVRKQKRAKLIEYEKASKNFVLPCKL